MVIISQFILKLRQQFLYNCGFPGLVLNIPAQDVGTPVQFVLSNLILRPLFIFSLLSTPQEHGWAFIILVQAFRTGHGRQIFFNPTYNYLPKVSVRQTLFL